MAESLILQNIVTTYDYDALNRVSKITAPKNGQDQRAETSFYYDQLGNVRYTIDPRGAIVETQYDALGRAKKTIYPDTPQHEDEHPSVESFYNIAGSVAKVRDQSGRETDFITDARGRVLTEQLPAVGGVRPEIKHRYNTMGRSRRRTRKGTSAVRSRLAPRTRGAVRHPHVRWPATPAGVHRLSKGRRRPSPTTTRSDALGGIMNPLLLRQFATADSTRKSIGSGDDHGYTGVPIDPVLEAIGMWIRFCAVFLATVALIPQSLAQTAEREALLRAKRATVFIRVASDLPGKHDEQSSGSGFLYSKAGSQAIVVTNNHVARPNNKSPKSIKVFFHAGTDAERECDAVVFAHDEFTDLATLLLEEEDLPDPIDSAGGKASRRAMRSRSLGSPWAIYSARIAQRRASAFRARR